MGINYSIDAKEAIVRLEYVHGTSVEELMATMRAIFRSPRYRPGFGFLADRRNVDAPTWEYVERVAAFMVLHREKVVGGRWALVVGSSASHDMGRMGRAMVENAQHPMPIRIFNEIDEAERWLRETAPRR